MDGIEQKLLALRDEAYADFQRRLLPTLPPASIIGVRTPALRALAKELAGTAEAEAFLQALPHRCFEENNLHAFLLEKIRGYDACVAALDVFLPHVDNWATCDQLAPPALGRELTRLDGEIRRWLASPRPFTVRFGIGMRMRHFLDGAFRTEYLDEVSEIDSNEYYVNMMAAWFFATALAKQYDAALPYLEARRLPRWTHNKAIRKAIESRRLTDEQKAYLRTLKER